MGTIKIELPHSADASYEIENEENAEIFLREFEILIKKAESEKNKKNGLNRSEKLRKAHDYLESLKDKKESVKARQKADEMRKSWIRKYD
ncbi:hypothetical protein BH24ACI2_BH24ACI2_03330 [soil metagenome]|nr:hypothetical protein [Acidobacteriota bacterium]